MYRRAPGPDLRHSLRVGARTQCLYGSAGQRHNCLRQTCAQAIRRQKTREFQGLHYLRCARRAHADFFWPLADLSRMTCAYCWRGSFSRRRHLPHHNETQRVISFSRDAESAERSAGWDYSQFHSPPKSRESCVSSPRSHAGVGNEEGRQIRVGCDEVAKACGAVKRMQATAWRPGRCGTPATRFEK